MKLESVCLCFTCLLCLACSLVSAQERTEISGVLRDSAGAALPGARVTIVLPNGERLQTTTDASGRYRFRNLNLREGASFSIVVGSEGHPGQSFENLRFEAGRRGEYNLTLLPSEFRVEDTRFNDPGRFQPGDIQARAALHGVLTDRRGAVIPNARLTLTLPDGTRREALTDTQGRYRFADLPGGNTYSLMVEREGMSVQQFNDISVQPEGTATRNLILADSDTPTAGGLADAFSATLESLPEGKILFNPPAHMLQGVKARVEVRISREVDADLRAGLKGLGVPEEEAVKVSAFMAVRLSGDSDEFEIQAHQSQPEQLVGATGFTQWSWDVTPLKSGERTLHLLVTARLKLEGDEERRDYPVFDRRIDVQINLWYLIGGFWAGNWHWLLSTFIIAPIAFVIALWFKKRFFPS